MATSDGRPTVFFVRVTPYVDSPDDRIAGSTFNEAWALANYLYGPGTEGGRITARAECLDCGRFTAHPADNDPRCDPCRHYAERVALGYARLPDAPDDGRDYLYCCAWVATPDPGETVTCPGCASTFTRSRPADDYPRITDWSERDGIRRPRDT